MNYYEKYLKYKNKYLKLKEQVGGINSNYINYAISSHGAITDNLITMNPNITIITYNKFGCSMELKDGTNIMSEIKNGTIFSGSFTSDQNFYINNFYDCKLGPDNDISVNHPQHFSTGVFVGRNKIIEINEETTLSHIINQIVKHHSRFNNDKKIYIHCLFCLDFSTRKVDHGQVVFPANKIEVLDKPFDSTNPFRKIEDDEYILGQINKLNNDLDQIPDKRIKKYKYKQTLERYLFFCKKLFNLFQEKYEEHIESDIFDKFREICPDGICPDKIYTEESDSDLSDY